ncbi:MAG: nucleoside-diphosphate-sugar epimerase [Gammaproteobacteria bacterium]
MARVLIAGCGDLGSAAGSLLVAAGHEVFGIRRRCAAIAAGITPIAADLCDLSSLQCLPDRVDTLIYVAAADGFSDDAYERAYVIGLRNTLSVVNTPSLCRVIFVSSTSVYAQDDGSWVNERSASEPSGFSGQRLLQAEALLDTLECDTSVVRFAGIYGPGRTRLLEQVRAGASCVDEPVQWTNRIHRDDCAGVLHHVALLDAPEALYIGVDNEPAARCAVVRWLAGEMGAPQPQPESEPMQATASAASPRRRGGNKRCSNRRLLDSGYQFIYPSFKEGYAALLRA